MALALPAWGEDPIHDSLVYCDGGADGGAAGAATDAEHTIVVGDPPFPPRVRDERMTVDGVSTRVVEAGPRTAEEAVVFVHGNPGSSRDFDSFVAQTGGFARAVAFDVPGFGHSDDRRGGPYTTTGAARFIDDLTKRLGIQRVHMVLHDFGGPWGLEWGRFHGDRLESVVLIDTGVFIGYYGHPSALVWHTPVTGEVYMGATTRQTFTAFLQANNPKPLPSRFVDRMYDDFDRATRCASLHYYRAVSNPDQMGRDQAASLKKRVRPALVVWGAQDPYVPVSLAKTQKQAFPAAEIHVLQGDGHWPFVDEPKRVLGLVEPFLRRVVHSPRFVVSVGHPRAGGRTSLGALVRIDGAPFARRTRLSLHREGKLVASSPRVTVGTAAARVTMRLRHPLRAGRYRLRVGSPDVPAESFAIVVR
jgi:pimeloyl-ACP methyl ester carboxylesterase